MRDDQLPYTLNGNMNAEYGEEHMPRALRRRRFIWQNQISMILNTITSKILSEPLDHNLDRD
jgi:hypothetical protein